MKIITNSPDETIRWGRRLGRRLLSGDVIALMGELGSGKTTFTKGIAIGLGIKKKCVNSPSFIIIRKLCGGRLPFYHLDLYRLNNPQEIYGLGLEEFLYDDGVSVIEWAEKAKRLLPEEYLEVKIITGGERKRTLQFHPEGGRFRRLVRELCKVE